MGAPITLRGPIEQLCAQAKKAGYGGLEIQLQNALQYDWEHIRKVTRDYGLEVTAISTGREIDENGLCLISDDAAVRRAAIRRLKEDIDCASVVSCPVIVCKMRDSLRGRADAEKYRGYHRDAVLELADYAQSKDTVILIENTQKWISDYLNSVAEVTDFVSGLERDNVKVHIDTWAMAMEDNDMEGSIRYCSKKLGYVHYSDTGRYYPGGGNLDFKLFTKALMKVGYEGWIVTECIPVPTPLDCARLGYEYMTAVETLAHIELGSRRF